MNRLPSEAEIEAMSADEIYNLAEALGIMDDEAFYEMDDDAIRTSVVDEVRTRVFSRIERFAMERDSENRWGVFAKYEADGEMHRVWVTGDPSGIATMTMVRLLNAGLARMKKEGNNDRR